MRSKLTSKESVEAIRRLAETYKEFKKKNPRRSARVPTDIKLSAKQVLDGGATYREIADATGLKIQSVMNWIANLEVSPMEKQPINPVCNFESPKSPASNRNGWVLIRIEGRELEVRKEDFWPLVAQGF